MAIAAILAGGRSSRMGRDKALVPLVGIAMLERVVGTARKVASRVILLGRSAAPPNWPHDLSTLEFLADADAAGGERRGPMAALVGALEHVQKHPTAEDILLLACDMPLVQPATLQTLFAAHDAHTVNGANIVATLRVIEIGPRKIVEPCPGIYTLAALPLLRDCLHRRTDGGGSFQDLLADPHVGKWQVPPSASAELMNVNDETSLREAERICTQSTYQRF